MIQKISRALFVSCLFLAPAAWAEEQACPTPAVLAVTETAQVEFDGAQGITLRTMIEMLSREHFSRVDIDDGFSSQWLENYLRRLDPSRLYFFSSDIAEFRRNYADQLDNLAMQGDLTPAKVIYERYRERALARLDAVLATLENPDSTFDYSTNDELVIDREDAQWPANQREADELWHKQLTLGMLNSVLGEREDTEARTTLARRYKTLANNIRQQDGRVVAEFYFNALTQIYDPHTNYFSPRDAENFDINMSLSLQGIGAVLTTADEYTEVVSIVVGGPAALGDELKPADKIVAIGEGIDCEFIDVVGWRLDEVVSMIRGPKGTTVRLSVIPAKVDPTSEERRVVTIVRDAVKLEDNATKGEILIVENGGNSYRIGVIDIPSFYLDFEALRQRDPNYRSTTQDTRKLLREFQEQGIDGLIIDLRGNGGGSLQEAATLTDLFVDPGPVVQIRDWRGNMYRDNRARTRQEYSGPLMVLVDRLSASASEIFAGAIQDYDRGLVVGQRTFGKGTVQTVKDLPEGQLKLTESKFYRITGASTQHRGVEPDIMLPSFYDEDIIGESSYDNPLVWDEVGSLLARSYEDLTPYVDELMPLHSHRLATDPDLVYLMGYLNILDERSSNETVSLNMESRASERAYWLNREEALLNAWKLAKGIPLEDDEASAEAEDAVADDEETAFFDALAEDDEDPNTPDLSNALLRETAQIFSDLLTLLSGSALTAATTSAATAATSSPD